MESGLGPGTGFFRRGRSVKCCFLRVKDLEGTAKDENNAFRYHKSKDLLPFKMIRDCMYLTSDRKGHRE